MIPAAILILARIFAETGRPDSIAAASFIAASVKLADLALPGRGPSMALRPALAILLEGLLIAALYAASAAPAAPDRMIEPVPGADRMVRTCCPAHNCGGRCLLRVWVRGNTIIRIDTDDRPTDEPSDPQLRACVRGRSLSLPPEPRRPPSLSHEADREARRGEIRPHLLGRSVRDDGRANHPHPGHLRLRFPLRPLRHRQLQPDQRPEDGRAPAQPRRRSAGLLQQLLLGLHLGGHADRLRHGRHRATSARTG